MLMFWMVAAAMLVATLALLLRPLLRTAPDPLREKLAALEAARAAGVLEEAEYQRKRAVLVAPDAPARPARSASLLILVLLVVVPVSALLLYRLVGEPRALDPAALAGDGSPATSAPALEDAIAGLAKRLEDNPQDLEGWLLLGRAYKSTQQFEEARQALAKARAIDPQNPDAMVEYAEALALGSPDRRIEGEAHELIAQALAIDPAQQRALWLLGIAEVQAERYAEAVLAWEKLLALLPPESDVANSVREQIAEARARGGLPGAADVAQQAPAAATPTGAAGATGPIPSSGTAAADGPRLTVQVELSPELAAQLTPNDVLFVFARAPQGPKMPLAIQRVAAPKFPLTITLDDSMGMMPSLKLSQAAQVVVGARVSRTGIANAQSGDFEAISEPLAPAQQALPIRLLIAKVLP